MTASILSVKSLMQSKRTFNSSSVNSFGIGLNGLAELIKRTANSADFALISCFSVMAMLLAAMIPPISLKKKGIAA